MKKPSFEVDPYEFLIRAEADFELGDSGAELNAITNAKRAIVCQMDQALMSFGYPSTKWNIPRKLEALRTLGLVAPRILKRVSASRNLLEHEYERPSKAEIEDALDIAALFVFSIKPILQSFGDTFFVGNSSEHNAQGDFQKGLLFDMPSVEGAAIYRVCAYENSKWFDPIGETQLQWTDDAFSAVVSLAVALDRDFRVGKALYDLCVTMEVEKP